MCLRHALSKKKLILSSLKKKILDFVLATQMEITLYRCMEEGADEFFLKPVQLSDVSRLKPHILKKSTKCQDQNQNKSGITINSSTNNVSGIKRKATDDGIWSERIRPRYSGGPVTIV
jgi:two-component response regulator ARR-A family